jgi:hypothetical protein
LVAPTQYKALGVCMLRLDFHHGFRSRGENPHRGGDVDIQASSLTLNSPLSFPAGITMSSALGSHIGCPKNSWLDGPKPRREHGGRVLFEYEQALTHWIVRF